VAVVRGGICAIIDSTVDIPSN
jgi:hypothetical protein